MAEYFAKERQVLQTALDAIIDPVVVSLGEMIAENMMGDPHLGPVMRTAGAAQDAASAATALLRFALEQLKEAERQEGGTP